jgi:hypothetical protein
MPIRLEQIERLHLALLAAAVCGAHVTGWFGPGSVLFGGAVMGANFWLLKQMVRRLVMVGERGRRVWVVLALMIGKFLLFMGLLGLLFWRVPLDPMGFAVGATVLLVACVVVAVRSQSEASKQSEPLRAAR